MALPVARHRQGVDGIEPVAGGHQNTDQQAPIELDAHHNLLRFLCVLTQQRMEASNPLNALRDSGPPEHRAVLINDARVVVRLGPVHANEDHCRLPSIDHHQLSPEEMLAT
jgi:hypothetical protein